MSSYNNHGESGQHAAESTKAAFKHLGDATESIRQNINSYADNVVPKGNQSTSRNNNHDPLSSRNHGTTSHDNRETTPLNERTLRNNRETPPLNNHETTSPNTHETTAPLNTHETAPHTYQHESTGIHPDAKRAGDALLKGAGAAGGKIEGFWEKHHHKKY